MFFESIKTIIFTVTLLVLFYDFLSIRIIRKTDRLFLLSSIVLTFLVILIITIKLHHLLRDEFNISNTITYIVSSIPFTFHFYHFKNIILKSNIILLLLSIGFIVLAVLFDLLTDGKIILFGFDIILEETFRIVGAIFWLLYYIFYSIELRKHQAK